ncbi:MAG: nucleotide exchange factor GrpE [Clostridiales Family XIII bacterium]|jgi:molecular chaperone GrpE|nr:nucleotide exchange factor GrpE [Clostridiales Family XIII bacterium]
MSEKKHNHSDEDLKKRVKTEADPEAEAEPEADSSDADEVSESPIDEDAAENAEESENLKYLRLAADFQNYKKRTEKERFERYSDGKKDFVADLLPVLDNFDRAIAQDIAADADSNFLEGMEMIRVQLQGVLANAGVEEIPAEGEVFDPNFHNAVMMEASDQYESGEVTEVLQKGYKLGEKVIRPAMVKVAQ